MLKTVMNLIASYQITNGAVVYSMGRLSSLGDTVMWI